VMNSIKFELPIYTYDIDFNNHVSNIVNIKWMEIGRLKLLEHVGMPVTKIMEQGFGPLLVDTIITYKKPLLLADKVNAEVWLSELGKASAWMEFHFTNGDGETAATGRQRGMFLNYKTGKPHRISEEDRSRFEVFLRNNP